MPATSEIPVTEHLRKMAPAVRSIVQAARRTVKEIAPQATEISYQSQPPRSKSAMWKIARYTVDGSSVVGIGTFSTYSAIFFSRGRELDDKRGLLEGGGKDARFLRLRTAADAEQPAVKRLVREAFTLGGIARRPRDGD